MSRDRGTITFKFDETLNGRQWLTLLDHLKEAGWTYEHEGMVLVSPLNADAIAFGGVALSRDALERLVDAKGIRDEALLLLLRDANGDSACTLYQRSEEFSVFLGDTSRDVPDHLIVDYGHYLSIFLPVLFELKGAFGLNVSAYVDRV